MSRERQETFKQAVDHFLYLKVPFALVIPTQKQALVHVGFVSQNDEDISYLMEGLNICRDRIKSMTDKEIAGIKAPDYNSKLRQAMMWQTNLVVEMRVLRDRTENSEYKRYLSIAITEAENALLRLRAIEKGDLG